MPSEMEAVLHAHLMQAEDERDRYREALERIERDCGDDSRPEDNAVQVAREALGAVDPIAPGPAVSHTTDEERDA